MKRVLLTGGSGFIGKNILESPLTQKYDIVAPHHEELDCTDDEAVDGYFRKNRFDYVIHSATKPGHRNARDPSGIFYANTRMFFNLARHSSDYKRMIVIGSGAIYDMRHYHPFMREDEWNHHVPVDEHGFSKYVCGSYIERSQNICDLRVFGIFGKHEDYSIRFISNMICKSLFDLPLTMKQERKFSYLYVEDLFAVLDRFIESDLIHKAYNIVPEEICGLHDLAVMVLNVAGKSLPIVVNQPGEGMPYTGNNQRLRSEFGDIAFTPIKVAIRALFDWYSERKSGLNRVCLLEDK